MLVHFLSVISNTLMHNFYYETFNFVYHKTLAQRNISPALFALHVKRSS